MDLSAGLFSRVDSPNAITGTSSEIAKITSSRVMTVHRDLRHVLRAPYLSNLLIQCLFRSMLTLVGASHASFDSETGQEQEAKRLDGSEELGRRFHVSLLPRSGSPKEPRTVSCPPSGLSCIIAL
jgi:hypothetical protein